MADAAKGFLGGLLRTSASALASSYMNSISSAVSSTASPDNHQILEITGKNNTEDVARYGIFQRDEFVILHGPMDPNAFTTRTTKWTIIVHVPSSPKMLSVYRSNNQEEAVRIFKCYKGVLSVLVNCDIAVCDKQIMEKVCTKLRDPNCAGWTAAHAAAAFDLVKCLKHPLMKKFLNTQEGPLLRTPLHIAIEYKNMHSVAELVKANVDMAIKDEIENNIFHLAAKSSAQILKFIIDKLPPRLSPCVNDVNRDGMTPLGIACKANLAENVQELVAHSSQQLNLRDPKDGSVPIHWASGPETLSMLLELGSDPNIPNNSGHTALHIQARKGSLKGTLQLLCHLAYPDMKDEQGDTPLMVGGRLCSKVILQVLIAFDADVNLVNNRGESARHLISTSLYNGKERILFYLDSVGARRCPPSLQKFCTEGCKYSGTFKGIPPENYGGIFQPTLVHQALYAFSANREVLGRSRRENNSMDCSDTNPFDSLSNTSATGSAIRNSLLESHIGGRILCLDGGGIRGVVLTQVLMYMQREFGIPIVQLFDWISGTSTGGIMALCLASGKSPGEIQALYLRLKDKVFTGERPYNSEVMEDFLKQELGSETKMSNLQRPRLMITTSIADHRPADFHFFRNYMSPSVVMGEQDCCTRTPEEVYVWEAAKATGAAPSYFRLDGKYVDGGLVANNPTIDTLTEVTQFAAVMKATGETGEVDPKLPSVVVSLGTGVQPKIKANASLYDISKPDGFFDAIVKVPKIANIIALLVEQTTQTEGQVVERARAWCSSIGVPYFRFSPQLSEFIDLDEKNDEVLVNLMWETRAYMYAHHGSVLELKRILFANGTPPPE